MTDLLTIKVSLKKALREKQGVEEESNPYYDVYYDIENNLGAGFAESTVRGWVNVHSKDLPRADKAIELCRFLGTNQPLRAMADYLVRGYDHD